jgi:hypothetical protein
MTGRCLVSANHIGPLSGISGATGLNGGNPGVRLALIVLNDQPKLFIGVPMPHC